MNEAGTCPVDGSKMKFDEVSRIYDCDVCGYGHDSNCNEIEREISAKIYYVELYRLRKVLQDNHDKDPIVRMKRVEFRIDIEKKIRAIERAGKGRKGL